MNVVDDLAEELSNVALVVSGARAIDLALVLLLLVQQVLKLGLVLLREKEEMSTAHAATPNEKLQLLPSWQWEPSSATNRS